MSEPKRDNWGIATCEVCEGTGLLTLQLNEGDEREFECWYCDGRGEYEAAL